MQKCTQTLRARKRIPKVQGFPFPPGARPHNLRIYNWWTLSGVQQTTPYALSFLGCKTLCRYFSTLVNLPTLSDHAKDDRPGSLINLMTFLTQNSSVLLR